jgi:predicted DNA-binding protein with PD1-like motif
LRLLTGGGFPLLRFDRGDAFPASLEEWCAGQGIEGAAIVSGVGMLENVDLGVFDGNGYEHLTVLEPSEVLSLQGNVSIRDGKPFAHVHATLGRRDFSACGGHLFSGIVSVTLEVVLCMLDSGLVRAPSEGAFRPLDRA